MNNQGKIKIINSTLVLLFCFVLISVFSAGCDRDIIRTGKVTLEEDTVWSGAILIVGDVYVPPGITLTILPGTMIKFERIDEKSTRNLFNVESPYYPQAEIIVRGRLIAQGTEDEPIVFTSAETDAGPADWGAINILGSRGNIIEYVKILCAYNGIHAHSSSALISHSEFTRNGVAITFKQEYEFPDMPWFGQEAELTITHNLIHGNKGGIGFRRARTIISYNEIRENKFFGVWVKEDSEGIISYNDIQESKKNIFLYQAKGVKVQFNNIHDPIDYNIAVAEAQDTDFRAAHNWWGTINSERIEELIYDRMEDDEVARILYEPVLKSRVKGAGI